MQHVCLNSFFLLLFSLPLSTVFLYISYPLYPIPSYSRFPFNFFPTPTLTTLPLLLPLPLHLSILFLLPLPLPFPHLTITLLYVYYHTSPLPAYYFLYLPLHKSLKSTIFYTPLSLLLRPVKLSLSYLTPSSTLLSSPLSTFAYPLRPIPPPPPSPACPLTPRNVSSQLLL